MFGHVGHPDASFTLPKENGSKQSQSLRPRLVGNQKRAVYLGVVALILCAIGGGFALYVWKYGNPLKNVATKSEALAGGALHVI